MQLAIGSKYLKPPFRSYCCSSHLGLRLSSEQSIFLENSAGALSSSVESLDSPPQNSPSSVAGSNGEGAPLSVVPLPLLLPLRPPLRPPLPPLPLPFFLSLEYSSGRSVLRLEESPPDLPPPRAPSTKELLLQLVLLRVVAVGLAMVLEATQGGSAAPDSPDIASGAVLIAAGQPRVAVNGVALPSPLSLLRSVL